MPKIGDISKGSVVKILKTGALVQLTENETGFLHISEISKSFVTDVNDFLKIGDEVTVRVVNLNPEEKRMYLSIRLVDDTLYQEFKEKPAQPPKPKTKFSPQGQGKGQGKGQGQGQKRPFNKGKQQHKKEETDPAKIFENKMARFLKDSGEKIRTLQQNRERKQGGRKKPRNTNKQK